MSDAPSDHSDRPAVHHPAGPGLLTVGVEEEFLLVDPRTGRVVPAVEDVLAEIAPQLRGQVQREFLATQIEIGSAPVVGLDALRRSLVAMRQALADASERAGVRLLAIGTAPIGGAPPAPIADTPRFHRMAERFGAVAPATGLNGLHVHVDVPDRETGVRVLNHLRPWLPLLAAATANSPFYDGRDTGYASWRSVLWNMWPTVDPPPYLDSAAHYDELIGRLIDSGAMLDDSMLYWYARLSAHLPTVELRLGDVCPTVDHSILLAALVRALVATVRDDIDAGRPAPDVAHHLLTAAHWRAARDGLEGLAVEPASGRTRPAWHLLRRLVALVTPALERHGDLATVTLLLARLRVHGTTGDVAAVVPHLIRLTRG